MKIVAVVTLFHPSGEVGDNIASYADEVDGLILWDNTPPDVEEPPLPDRVRSKVVLDRRGENVGIGQALNEALRLTLRDGYTHLLAMDQDSRFVPGSFRAYLERADRWEHEQVGGQPVAFVPVINRAPSCGEPCVVRSFITSGTLFPARTLQMLGLFDEKLVIDGVDLEYAYRLRSKGGQIVQLSQGSLCHALGYPLRGRLLWWHPVSLNYSPMRVYYIARNFLYLKKRYPSYVNGATVRKLVWQRPFYILLMERQKAAKLRAWARGVAHGLLGKFRTY